MNTTSSAPASSAPQRRNRGTNNSAAANVSAAPTPSASGTLNCAGNCICTIRAAHPSGSVIFHTPDARKSTASKTALNADNQDFQAGKSTGVAPHPGCAILSSMNFIVVRARALPPASLPLR